MIYHYKLILQYKGTRYLGWQIQPEGKRSTIQGELNKALEKISKSGKVKTLGAGRTDAGVHALGQVVKVSMDLQIDPENLLRALNSNLAEDIRITAVEISDEEFMPTVHAKSKEYQYRFTSLKNLSPFQFELIHNVPFVLDLELMKKACEVLIGTHDFINYYCEGTPVTHYVRDIYECEIVEALENQMLFPSHYVFRIVGSGFLKQMVRLLIGAIWNVGRGKVTLEEFSASLAPPKITHLAAVAPAHGLYMVRVNY